MASERALSLLWLLLSGAALADVPAPRPSLPPPPPRQCDTDADCALVPMGCCPTCCPSELFATTQQAAAASREACARKRCAPLDCREIACASYVRDPVRAACRAGRCVTVPETPEPPPPAAECRADQDCVLTTMPPPPQAACRRSPCGCCPTHAAVPASRADGPLTPSPPKRSGSRPQPPSSAPAFGLSEGGTPPPQCSPCPGPAGVPVCRAGRCALASPVPLTR